MNIFALKSIISRCALPLVAVASGCTVPENACNGLFLPKSAQLPAVREETNSTTLPMDDPSLTQGTDRSHWQSVTIMIPQAAVGVHPNFTTTALRNPRHDGNVASIDNALDEKSDAATRILDVPIDLGFVIYDALAAPVRVFITPPWTVIQEPAEDFQLLGDTSTGAP